MACRRAALVALALSLAALAACGDRGRGDAGLEELPPARDTGADALDAGPDVPPIDPCAPPACGPAERCGAATEDGGAGTGNGLDDNCNGTVDEGCLCDQDTVESCFPGPPDRRGIGACRDGTALCTELGIWGACRGAVVPTDEVCDGVDNDCDGRADDGLTDCAGAVQCPANGAVRPLTDYTLDGRTLDPTARAFRWTLECPASVSPCPALAAPDEPVLRLRPLQSGTYVVRVTITRADGSSAACRFPLYVQGTGLRVELGWDTQGGINGPGVDMDLHLAPIDRARPRAATWFSPDDCYYATCAAPGGRVDWSLSPADTRFAPSVDASGCEGAPPPNGERWRKAGRCWNPRLDTDNITCDRGVTDPRDPAFCFVENINVDSAPEDVTFRVMVNFYRDHGACTDAGASNDVTHPRLQVFCGGFERAEIGGVDDGQVGFRCGENAGIGSANWSWLAADVRFGPNACGLRDCVVRPLRARPRAFTACASAAETDDVCQDGQGRVFVRRAGARPVDAELAESF